MEVTFEEREACNTDWGGWERYVCYREITEYEVSAPIMLNATEAKKNEVLKRKMFNFEILPRDQKR